MPRTAQAIHVVEKEREKEHLRCVDDGRQEWETGYWIVSDATAESLLGGMVYVHRGQNLPAHKGGKIIDIYHQKLTDKKRRVIRFVALPSAVGEVAPSEGWGNERKLIWSNGPAPKITPKNDDDESAFPEGAKKFKLHHARERDSALTRKAKRLRLLKTGKLECEVCRFDFAVEFGRHGEGFIEAHHKTPVSKLDGKTKTKIADLALVCSNCHRMLHRGKPLQTIAGLAAKLCKT
jgi:hypothetical protein